MMRVMPRSWLLVGGVGVLLVALAATVRMAGVAAPAEKGPTGPIATVLVPAIGGSELVAIDLEAGRVARRIPLRSLVTDIAVDASTGLVVAAQSGGIGGDADNAVSIADVRTGAVRYVTLPTRDPGDVACLGGRVFVLHSVLEASGSVVTAVDVNSGKVVGGGHVEGCGGLWAAAAGAVWTTSGDGRELPALARLRSDGQGAAVSLSSGSPVFGIADANGGIALLGPSDPSESSREGLVRLFDPVRGSIVASVRSTELVRPPRQAVGVAERIIVGDWNGDEPEGRILEAFDATTLRRLGSLKVDGIPCALATWGDRLLVVDRAGGRLLVIDPIDARTLNVVDLGVKGLVYSDVVVSAASDGAR